MNGYLSETKEEALKFNENKLLRDLNKLQKAARDEKKEDKRAMQAGVFIPTRKKTLAQENFD